jgi:hypothetical protein
MAKFQDYVKKDEIEDEITEAGANAEDRNSGESSLPERFQGKTPEEIAASYVELEKAYSQQGNKLGEMRQTMDQYISNLQSDTQTTSSEEADETPVTIDDLYEDTEGAITRAAEKAVGNRVEALEAELANARLQTRIEVLDNKYGDWRSEVQRPEFLEWVQESPYRVRVAQAADQFDMDAAEELLGMYGDRKATTDLQAEVKRDSQLRDASLESSSAEAPARETRYSRSDVMDKRIRAQHGDSSAQSWLKANAEGIALAYEEKTLTD